MKQPINRELSLVPYYPAHDLALSWYQDPELCRQVDGQGAPYSLDRLKTMYAYLTAHGECYYIEYKGALVGDIILKHTGEICLVISKEYQNRHIGRRCVRSLLDRARAQGLPRVKAEIYPFNHQSLAMFRSLGFRPEGGDWYALDL